MKGPWKVTSNPIGGKTMYAVCRVLDVTAVDHSGNRVFATGYMADRDEAEQIAVKMNDTETRVEMVARTPFSMSISLDGNQYCALIGANLQEGIAGFGDTVPEVLRELADRISEEIAKVE